MKSDRPDVRPIFITIDRAIQDEMAKWTYDMPEEFRLALVRHVLKDLQQASMLNLNRPWEIDDRFGDVLREAGEIS